ncbi:MAG: hypothetical protein KatS3mg129_2455 [Leptospiraceae bacterium]|nr:MAG: hypothetical protein KatS3mg129_2455 [Leptospiraceae bacterium]
MKTIEITQEFPVPLDVLLKARQERYKHLDKFPELKNVKIIEETQNGNILHQVRHISIGASAPPILAQVLPKGADTLIEESDFYLDTNVHKFKVIPSGGNDNLFLIEGESIYEKKDENTSLRKYKIHITSKVLFIGGAIEAAIAEIYSNSLKKDQESIKHFIELLQKEEL